MDEMRIWRAEPGDLDAVLGLLTERAAWIRARGSAQWDGDLLAPERIARIVARQGTYLVTRPDATPLATITLSWEGDPDFWTPAELAGKAWYVSKMATSLEGGRGLGLPLLRWARDKAHQAGVGLLRGDVYRLPDGATLRAWYERTGARVVRDVEVPGKRSGFLLEWQAGPDPYAAMLFCRPYGDVTRMLRPAFPVGGRVFADFYGPGTVTDVTEPDAGDTERGRPDEGEPVRSYRVVLDTGRILWWPDVNLEPAASAVSR